MKKQKIAVGFELFVKMFLAVAIVIFCMPSVKAHAAMETINNFTWGTGKQQNVLSWDPVDGATKYSVYISPYSNSTTMTSFDCSVIATEAGTVAPVVSAYNSEGERIAEGTAPEHYIEKINLDTPTNIKEENGVITWNPVPNADYYRVDLYQYSGSIEYASWYGEAFPQEPKVKISAYNPIDEKQYFVTIITFPSSSEYGRSEKAYSEVFTYKAPKKAEITDITWGSGENAYTLSWSPIEGATSYAVDLAGYRSNTEKTSFDCTHIPQRSGTYTPCIIAYNAENEIVAEGYGPEKYFEVLQLDTPTNIKVDNGVITWDPVSDAEYYMVVLYNTFGSSAGYLYIYDTKVETSGFNVSDGEKYTVCVTAFDDDGEYKISESAYSESFFYETMYRITTSVSGKGGTISEGARVKKGNSFTVVLKPGKGRNVSVLIVNGVDVTEDVKDNKYVIDEIVADTEVVVSFSSCKHEWDEGVVTKKETCGETGEITYSCSNCEETKTEEIEKLPIHTWDAGKVIKKATCADAGRREYTCTVCGAVKDEVLARRTTHDYGEFVVTKEATCVVPGIRTKTCADCGTTFEEAIECPGSHDYKVTYSWAADGKSCKATVACRRTGCGEAVKVNGTVTKTVKQAATYFEAGITHYTAKFVVDGVTYKSTKDLTDIPKKTLGVVQGFAVTNATTKDLTLSWNVLKDATGYIIEKQDGENWVRVTKTTDASVLTYKVTGLSEGSFQAFRIRGYITVDGKSANGANSDALQTATKLKTITGVEVAGASTNAIRLAWNKNVATEGYQIEQYADGQWKLIKKLTSQATTEYRIENLKEATEYKFRIRAYKVGAVKTYSEYTEITAWTKFKALTGLKVAGASSNAIRMTWDVNLSADGYRVEQLKGGEWTLIKRLVGAETKEYRVEGLAPATKYQFRVCAYKKGASTVYSAYATLTTQTKFPAMTGVKVAAKSDVAVKIAWDKNASADGYHVEKLVDGKWTLVKKIADPATLAYKVTGLASATKYSFRVRAYRVNENGAAYSDYVTLDVTTK